MNFSNRIRAASKACLAHLLLSALVALAAALLVFFVWYPYPYAELVGGRELFFIVISVDVVCGPLLTLIVFSPTKPRSELIRDIGLIALVQIAALAYGLHSVALARPVYLAFEGDRFRAVMVPDIDTAQLKDARAELRSLSLTGPKPIGAALAKNTDPDFLASLKLSLDGLHPAFRPGRWGPYDEVRQEVAKAALPLTKLMERYPDQARVISEVAPGEDRKSLGYLPLLVARHTDWVVVVSLKDGEPRGFLHLDGW